MGRLPSIQDRTQKKAWLSAQSTKEVLLVGSEVFFSVDPSDLTRACDVTSIVEREMHQGVVVGHAQNDPNRFYIEPDVDFDFSAELVQQQLARCVSLQDGTRELGILAAHITSLQNAKGLPMMGARVRFELTEDGAEVKTVFVTRASSDIRAIDIFQVLFQP